MGAKCEGLYRLFLFFGVFQFKNNREIPSIWRHFGARLGVQNAKEYIAYFHILSHKVNFLENPKFENSRSSSHTGTQNGGSLERPKDKPPGAYNDFSGRPQGAPTAAPPLDRFPAFRPHTPHVKYLPGGPPPPSNKFKVGSLPWGNPILWEQKK